MIKYVFLDLDNTLLDFNWAERNALSRTLEALGVSPSEEMLDRYNVINLSQWKRLEKGEITRQQVKEGRYRILFDEFNIDASPADATDIYEGFLRQGHKFLEGAQSLLESLKGKYKLYLVSNGTWRVQDGRLDSAGLKPVFDGLYISELVGAEKPSRLFFDKVFADIDGFEKESAVIIGDSLTSDIQGGINAGIKTVWFNRGGSANTTDIKPDYEVTLLSQLPLLLTEI